MNGLAQAIQSIATVELRQIAAGLREPGAMAERRAGMATIIEAELAQRDALRLVQQIDSGYIPMSERRQQT